MPLQGKRALVTGSSRGIGRGIALKLAERGVNIAVHYHTQSEAAKETLDQVQALGAKGCLIQADVTRTEDIQRMFDQVRRELGGLDIFVSNARPELAAFYRPPMDLDLDHWRGTRFPSAGVPTRVPGVGQADARGRPHHRDQLLAERADR